MRQAASESSGLDTELLFGTNFIPISEGNDWVFGREVSHFNASDNPGYEGWVHKQALSTGQTPGTHFISSLKAPVFLEDDIKSPIQCMLHMNACVSGVDAGAFLRTDMGFIHGAHIRGIDQPPATRDFVSVAEAHMGLPYVWGGISTDGPDCSGLVQSSLRAVGRDIIRDTKDQVTAGEKVTYLTDLRRGDLIFWPGHVAIMTDPSEIIHANAHHMCVFKESLDQAVKRIGPITAMRRI
jgi:hypothetical protein